MLPLTRKFNTHAAVVLSAAMIATLTLWSPLYAQEVPPPPALGSAETAQAPDEVPDEVADAPAGGEEGVEPEVTIIRRRDAVIEEYRLNGQLYRIRVIPRWGPPYYLIPTHEAGVWRTEVEGELAPVTPAQWLLFSW